VLAIFAATEQAEGGLFNNPWVEIIMVFLACYIFLKFCSWAKKFQLSGSLKKWVFIITVFAVIFFNVLYSQGNAKIAATGDWSGATIALLASLAWVIFFAFVLMAQTKTE
jgi:predicted neutral ceramidase superfamily lipid hydrolase